VLVIIDSFLAYLKGQEMITMEDPET